MKGKRAPLRGAPATPVSAKDLRDCAVYAEGWTKGDKLFLQGFFTRAEAHARGVDLAGRGMEVVLWEGLREGDAERTIIALRQPGIRIVS